jgi:hypothetical protein
MRYAELSFEPFMTLQVSGAVAEAALAKFPNGWGLSVLRGMAPFSLFGDDFETCRQHPEHGMVHRSIERHRTVEAVQRENDTVAAL